MPRILPEPRYFSMPSIEVGADVRMKRALNCWPWVRSLTHSPDAVIHSPAEIVAALPTTVRQNFLGRRLRLSHRSSHGGELAAALAVRPHLPHGSSGHFVEYHDF